MEDTRFDVLAERLGRVIVRREAFGFLAGMLGVAQLAANGADAKKRRKGKKKKKPNRCRTFGNATISCPKGAICCDPVKSTGAGCADAGYPVCCVSTMHAYPADFVCCASAAEGSDGICDSEFPVCCPGPPQSIPGCCKDEYPNCCPESIGGCCEEGYPVCCSNATFGEYCCPQGSTCCETDPYGCCETASSAEDVARRGARQGAWQPSGRDGARSDRGRQFHSLS